MSLPLLKMFVRRIANDPVVSKSSELLRLGLMPSMEELKAGKVSFIMCSISSVNADHMHNSLFFLLISVVSIH
jgi:hypothetical protein